nr:hypothetical protein [Tanacetum cinerariifolium]
MFQGKGIQQVYQSSSFAPDTGKAMSSAVLVFAILNRKSEIDPNDESGESGSGKSTVISLLQRFYNPDSGAIILDGVELQKNQLKWLRLQMGLVSQETVLFNDTIRANISYGKDGYDTVVGERGIELSGGHKKRVAIARAIVKSPKILLLDEATSALDAKSERVVQDALDKVMVNRTSVVVAHSFSTIKGVIVDKGKHEDLINIQGRILRIFGCTSHELRYV